MHRNETVHKYNKGELNVLISTSLCARGLGLPTGITSFYIDYIIQHSLQYRLYYTVYIVYT